MPSIGGRGTDSGEWPARWAPEPTAERNRPVPLVPLPRASGEPMSGAHHRPPATTTDGPPNAAEAPSTTQPLGAVPPHGRTNGDAPEPSGGRHARRAAPEVDGAHEPESRDPEHPPRKNPTHAAENPDSRVRRRTASRPMPSGPGLTAPKPISGPPAIPKPRPNPIPTPKPVNGSRANPLTWSADD